MLWCSVINFSILLIWFAMFVVAHEFIYSLLSSAIQKCTKTQCKNAPLRNTYYLTEISNNPASLFCFNL
ncbi:DUF6868 family protein [Sulfurimonas hongkongensis]|uniref:DUF6868 family protein n=1 Tax=Sulfurimonas hongkongensis TaxID=1172190 RepID=UPI003CCBC117